MMHDDLLTFIINECPCSPRKMLLLRFAVPQSQEGSRLLRVGSFLAQWCFQGGPLLQESTSARNGALPSLSDLLRQPLVAVLLRFLGTASGGRGASISGGRNDVVETSSLVPLIL